MARINIDDELHAEKGFKRLVRILENEDLAVGLLYRFWREAQDLWGDGGKLMSQAEFMADGFEPILKAGLARESKDGIEAVGGRVRFAWYRQKKSAAKKSVESRFGQTETNSVQTQDDSVRTEDAPVGTEGSNETESRSNAEGPALQPTVPVPVPATVPVTSTATVPASAPPVAPGNRPPQSPPVYASLEELKRDADSCEEVWLDTLRSFNAGRKNLLEFERLEIMRALQKHKSAKAVSFALEGPRYDKPTEKFDRGKFLSLERVLNDDDFQRWVNLAVREHNKRSA